MSNETRHYFGAYVEIETAERAVTEFHRACANGHKENRSFDFCPICGAQITTRSFTAMKRPASLYELLRNSDEQLTSITPPHLYGKKIIAIANTTSAGEWLIVNRFSGDNEVLDFPTEAEIASLKSALETTYADVISTLRQHPAVLSVTVKAGYVLDTEY
jgi:hypothetical protein